MRYIVLLPTSLPLGGVCPSCRQIMDDSGCRVGRSVVVDEDVRRRTGVARALELECYGEPVVPIASCPACGKGDP